MADDGIERFEAMLGAISKIASGDDQPTSQLTDARCPKCAASDFIKVSDLYDETLRRMDDGTANDAAREHQGGLSDRQILEKVTPPFRRSAVPLTIVFAVPLGVVAFFIYRRFGDTAGQSAIVATIVALTIFFLTRVRRLSDQYYDRRRRWNKAFMCRRCGQLVAP